MEKIGYQYKIVLIVLVTLIFNSCIKESCRDISAYEFVALATLSPAQEVYKVGDTISIESNFSDLVYERRTNASYKLENFNFFPSTEIVKIDIPVGERFIPDYFEVIIDSISNYGITFFSGGQSRIQGEYSYKNNSYHLGYKLVAKLPGLYYMEQGISPDLGDPDFEGPCSRARIDGVVNLNGGSQNNIELLKLSPDSYFNTWILEKPDRRFFKFGGYCFKVEP
jgi:hypothetical protein